MPQPLFLHIRSKRRGLTRVVEVLGDVARIGRGQDCEVLLDDPAISEVECFLRRHGESWHVQPLTSRRTITIDGRPVTHLRAIAFCVPMRIGEAQIVLRDTPTIAPEFGAVEFPISIGTVSVSRSTSSVEDGRTLGENPYDDPLKARALRDVTDFSVHETKPLLSRRLSAAERLWQARWKAVGRSIRPEPLNQQQGIVLHQPDEQPSWLEFSSNSPGRNESSETQPLELQVRAIREELIPSAPEPGIVPFVDPVESRPEHASETFPPKSDLETSTFSASNVIWANSPEAVVTTLTHVIPCESLDSLFRPIDAGSLQPIPAPSPAEPQGEQSGSVLSPSRPRPRRDRPIRGKLPQAPSIAPVVDSRDEEWPSVSTILGSRTSPRPLLSEPRAKIRRPMPTVAVEPGHWTPPRFLFFVTSAAAILIVGAVGLYLAFAWGRDDSEAGALADRLLKSTAKSGDIIAESEINPDGTWWRTTGNHLALRAAALGMGRGEPSREEAARFLLGVARSAAPLEPATRLARAEFAGNDDRREVPLLALGLSRDTLSLALTGRILARAGKTKPAIAAYRASLELAAESEIGRGSTLTLFDEAGTKRFALPSEELVTGVILEMAGHSGWDFATWSESLPNHGLVWLCVYRVLKDRNSPESESALTQLVESTTSGKGSPAVQLAAKAEGKAIQGHWQEAESLYSQAIAAMSEASIGRTWHLNRAVILARGGETEKANEAVVSARAGRGDDEIGRKVAQAIRREGLEGREKTAARTAPGQTLKTN